MAAALAVSAALVVTACSPDDGSDATSGTATPVSSESAPATTGEQDALPTAADLAVILDRAVDPQVPTGEKVDTVEDGEQAAELFEVMTTSKQESGAEFEVVDPVLPGDTPEIALATMNLTLPGEDPNVVENVEFVEQDEQWKLSRQWACTLVENVAPDRIPPLCGGDPGAGDAEAPEGAPAPQDAPAPEGEPAPEPAPEPEAAPEPAPAPPPAPAGDPAIHAALVGAGVDPGTADQLAADPAATVAAAERMGIDRATADQFASNPQGAVDALRAAGVDPVTAAPMLAAQL
ncbi:MAG: hypothetical protein ACTH1D_00960 [Mycobacteriaceae bacterium]|uniref:hypothetical protein n=1 Tax=Corynebacterium sp. TaxID=1720 RepID=UPI003F9A88D9